MKLSSNLNHPRLFSWGFFPKSVSSCEVWFIGFQPYAGTKADRYTENICKLLNFTFIAYHRPLPLDYGGKKYWQLVKGNSVLGYSYIPYATPLETEIV